MQEQLGINKEIAVRIGPDQVTVSEEEVIIEAARAMPNWEVRDFNVIPVYFGDKKYFLADKRKASPPYSVRYVLKPWHSDLPANAKFFHTYDAEAVAERDGAHRSGVRDEIIRCCLFPFYPLLGFLWSGAQNRLGRFGFVPRSITSISIFTVFALTFLQGVFAVIMLQASARVGKMMPGGMIRALAPGDHIQLGPIGIPLYLLDALLFLAFLADVLVRYSHYLRDNEWIGGFLEWMIPESWRKKNNADESA